MNRAQQLAMKEVRGIKIGMVTNITYDVSADIVLIIEENAHGSFDPYRHVYGTNAPELKELLETLKEYYIETLNEKLRVFDKIYEVMGE
jgi:hypothetical protein